MNMPQDVIEDLKIISNAMDRIFVHVYKNEIDSKKNYEQENEKAKKIAEGFIPLALFIKQVIHPKYGMFLAATTLGGYLRDEPHFYQGTFYKEKHRSQYYVHPELFLDRLASHGGTGIRRKVQDYLKIEREFLCQLK